LPKTSSGKIRRTELKKAESDRGPETLRHPLNFSIGILSDGGSEGEWHC
jgi:hypothetical protein